MGSVATSPQCLAGTGEEERAHSCPKLCSRPGLETSQGDEGNAGGFLQLIPPRTGRGFRTRQGDEKEVRRFQGLCARWGGKAATS